MTTSEPIINDTDKLPIGKAAEILQMHRETLRKAVDKGLIRCTINKMNQRKTFTGREIKRFWQTQY